MALPALEIVGDADVQVLRYLTPLLRMAPVRGRVLPLDRGARGFREGVRALRAGRYERGVLLTPSIGSAALFAAGGVRARRGSATDRRGLLLSDAVPRERLASMHRADAYCFLVTGNVPERTPVPRLVPDEAAVESWRRLAGDLPRPLLGIFPGSNAPSRRWAPARFAEVARMLARRAGSVVVFGGPQERAITAEVAGDWAFDAGGRTDLPALAAGLAGCRLVISNDSGPLHLAAAVGTPTVSLWGAGNPAVTGPVGARHELVRHAELPCVPCVKNECPRSGTGFFLSDAHQECMQLIHPSEVLSRAARHGAEPVAP
ncbi:MAG TPA: glycosyltransferase family 9 protein [Gemmatimonadaceae bacterium]|nr:glycosyltransferase family 9 protein [Gemmatimonadaceae bacterium]